MPAWNPIRYEMVVDFDGLLGLVLDADPDDDVILVLRTSDVDDDVIESYGYLLDQLKPLSAVEFEYVIDVEIAAALYERAAHIAACRV